MLQLQALLFLCLSLSCSATAGDHDAPHDLVRLSCAHASYPTICVRTLSAYKGPAKTPRDLAQAAVKVSLSRASKVSAYLTQVSSTINKGNNTNKKERNALGDCVEQIYESVEELSKTLNELKHLRRDKFSWQMSNVETWVSAALTNEDTCLDGFEDVDGKVKSDVKKKITNVARVTSNALYMINRLHESRERSWINVMEDGRQ
ncbi:pectinesterase inhibitor 3-like [Pistacia vera]|uniref:pectinesterase inhibitor 3-like n=1 Tax=Pistacia vera TaxID=55513 RepID=UPI001262D473|nr:pectinesterase inhibitor 3-like [Pistacia vera]XP_031260836.1 pectinesterase inhibitor 3-like [Pistacia vera]